MDTVSPTAYVTTSPSVSSIGHLSPRPKSGVRPFLKLPKPVTSKPVSDETFHRRAIANISILTFAITTVIFITIVIMDWSH